MPAPPAQSKIQIRRLLGAVRSPVLAALKEVRHELLGRRLHGVPDDGVGVALLRPPQLSFVPPDALVGGLLAVAHQVIRLVQEDGSALGVVYRLVKEGRVEGDDLKGKVGRGVRGGVPDLAVPPVVGRAVKDEVPQEEGLFAEALVVEDVDGPVDEQLLLQYDRLRRAEQGGVADEEDEAGERGDAQGALQQEGSDGRFFLCGRDGQFSRRRAERRADDEEGATALALLDPGEVNPPFPKPILALS